jgi:hypothetical protein
MDSPTPASPVNHPDQVQPSPAEVTGGTVAQQRANTWTHLDITASSAAEIMSPALRIEEL